jgi:tetratricopeptide (TPR) repeat protein
MAMRGDFGGARASSADAWALIEEFGLTLTKGVYAMDVGFAHTIAGELDQAERELRRGHDLLAAVGDSGARCTVDAMLGDVLVRMGRVEEAAHFAEASRTISGVDDLDAQPRWRAALARILSAKGAHEEAVQVAHEAVALVEPIDLLPLKALVYDAFGDALAAAGHIDEGDAAVEQAIALHEQKGNVVSAARSRTALDLLRAARPS